MKSSSPRARFRLWPRGRLDIGWRDLLFAARCPFLPGARPRRVWPTTQPHLALWSVRTAWDAILGIHSWPQGSEIVFSGANIPGMVRLIEAHGLVPVPVALDPQTLEMDARSVEVALTPKTCAILISPLFGSHFDLREIGAIAKKHGVLLVEDLAQAFSDSTFRGSPEADVSLFSFGLIKPRTALGGAVVFARDAQILQDMARHVRSYPRVSLAAFYAKWMRAAGLQMLAHPLVFGALWRGLQLCGTDPDVWLSQATRAMKGRDLLRRVRRQPHTAHVKLLRHRLRCDDTKALRNRIERGKQCGQLPGVLGKNAQNNVFWAVAVAVSRRDALIERAREEGFDISFQVSSVACFGEETPFSRALQSAVFLPVGTAMPQSEWARLLAIVREFCDLEVSG